MLGIFVLILFLGVYFSIAKNTPLEISVRRGKLAGILYFIGIFFFVLIGSIFYYYGNYTDYTKTFYITPANTQLTTYLIWYAVLAFLVTFALLTKRRYRLNTTITASARDTKKLSLVSALSITCCALTIVIFYAYGMRNALIGALLTHENIINIRLQNVASGIPTVAISYFVFLLHFNAILFGAIYKYSSRSKRILYVLFLIYALSWLGDKSLYLYVFFEFYISRVVFSNRAKTGTRPGRYVRVGILGLVLFGLFLFVVRLQINYDNFGEIIRYLMARGVLGQVQGVYEEFGLGLHDGLYALTALPLAHFFSGQQYFNKDLMMATWGAGLTDPSQTGVMNSFFIGEAFAIGGYVLVFFSPFIVAAAFLIGHISVSMTLRRLFGISTKGANNITVILIASTYWLTADIGGYLFLKITVMQLIFLFTIYIAMKLLSIRRGIARDSLGCCRSS